MISSVPEPLADFIFVHGLGGGSRKTWVKSKKDGQYWPKEWLAKDPNFQSVRLHSFGYKADWQERKDSILDIQDFALSLLGEMQDNPGIRKTSTRIVLIGHSMGGIVIKKV
jgi:pimeloyl-ACP methyl ester carboxylesterase